MGLIQAKNEVAGMLRSETPFDAIEDQIEQMPDLVAEERSALWLYAFSRQDGGWQRQASSQLLLFIANNGWRHWAVSPAT